MALLGSLAAVYGWLGDVVGTHVFVNGVPQALRRRWNFLGGVTVADNPSTETLDLTITGVAAMVGAPDVSISGRDVTSGATRNTLITSSEDTTIDAELIVKIGVNDANSVEIGHTGIEVKGGGARATGWADPSSAQDLATRAYVLAQVGAGVPADITNNESITGPGDIEIYPDAGAVLDLHTVTGGTAELRVRAPSGGSVVIHAHDTAPTPNVGDIRIKAAADIMIEARETTGGVSVRAGAAANAPSNGELILRGETVTLTATSDILVTGQLKATGIARFSTGDFNSGAEDGDAHFYGSADVYVETTAGDIFVTAGGAGKTITIDADNVEITGTLTNNGSPIGGGSYTAGDGLTLTGSDFDVDLSDTTIFSNAGVASRALVLDGSSRVIATALRRTGGTLTVETITSGDVVLAAADAVAISATVGGVAVNANTAIALNAATGDGSITLDGSGNIDVQVIAGGTLTETIGSASRTVTASGANRTETYGGNYSLIPGGNLVLGASGQDAYINCWGFQGTAYTNGFIFYTTNRAFRVADYNGLAEIILRPISDTATTDATQTTIATITPSTTRPTQFEVLVRVEDASGNMKAWHDVVACRGQGGSAAFSGGGTGAVGATVNGTADAAVTTCALEYDCSTTIVRVRATGIAATNLTWSVTILEVH